MKFLNEEVCGIVLIISGSTDSYKFFAAIFTELSKFWCEVFTLSWDSCEFR